MRARPAAADHLLALADQCVKCGLCLPHCPTYQLDRKESESPRGRIALAAALAASRLDATDATGMQALDHCLSCRACESVCPAGVRYGELLAETRALQRQIRGARWAQRAWELLLRRPRLLFPLIGWAARLRRALPQRWTRRWPPFAVAPAAVGWHRPAGPSRGQVGLFLGCIARGADAGVQRAAIRVLNQLGWAVWVPSAQGCCGSLHRHGGDAAGAAKLAVALRDAMRKESVEAVLVSASGCFEGVRDALAEVPLPVREVTEFVVNDRAFATLSTKRVDQSVVVQVPCTQWNVVGAGASALTLLRTIQGLRLHLLPRQCCGAAGLHAWFEPTRAAALRAPLSESIEHSDATIVASGNIGCRLHLAQGDTGPRRYLHPIELFAESLS